MRDEAGGHFVGPCVCKDIPPEEGNWAGRSWQQEGAAQPQQPVKAVSVILNNP